LRLQDIDVPQMAVDGMWLSDLRNPAKDGSDDPLSRSSVQTRAAAFPSLRRVSVRDVHRPSDAAPAPDPIFHVVVNAGSPFRNENAEVLMS
jgi:hypothetical protein